ncbi:hypothetical protein E1B28_002086 [Marasmius oreades]|uniref:Uncharacterized protein n=1 Tax=Marasmius oreades TaxID=181124 RepID=A0A9P7RMD9_9AGAR|nr:uncharacterized protein E1B28_002086 [Marasmius oreades]KAG7086127.1 hypothetical protein E1B28_002086 [Marasmius oreades]
MSILTFILVPFFLFIYLSSLVAGQGQGTAKCFDAGLDWYTGKVGETPCKTYERLRQICNSGFRVGAMNPNTPPDICGDQVANCCCNNIAFSLSMLCLTCQKGVQSSGTGFDAGKGAYQIYLTGDRKTGFCQPQTNKTLPADIQSAVCNEKINIYDDLYNIDWDDGSWFYIFMSQTITKDQIANPNKVFTKCPQNAVSVSPSNSTSTSASATSTSSSANPSGSGESTTITATAGSLASLSTGAVAGLAVGIAVALIAAALALFFCIRRKRRIERESRYISAGGIRIDGSSEDGRLGSPPAPRPYTYVQAGTSEYHATPVSHANSGGYFTDSASHGYTSTNPPSTISGNSHSGAASGAGNSSGSGLIVSSSVYSPSLTSPYSANRTTASRSTSQPHSTGLPGKAGMANVNLRNTRYIPPSRMDPTELGDSGPESERHVDAGPLEGAGLERNASGRLPPAYGDLVRDG